MFLQLGNDQYLCPNKTFFFKFSAKAVVFKSKRQEYSLTPEKEERERKVEAGFKTGACPHRRKPVKYFGNIDRVP